MQTTRKNGYGQLLGIGRREQKLHMLRRLLKGFEKRIKRLIRKHVHLVNEVHLVAATAGRVLNVVCELPHVIHTGAGCGINLDQINKPAFLNLPATGTGAAGSRRNTGFTVKTARQQTPDGGFTHSPGAGKQISMVQALVFQSVN